jgi:hypothetical protein
MHRAFVRAFQTPAAYRQSISGPTAASETVRVLKSNQLAFDKP